MKEGIKCSLCGGVKPVVEFEFKVINIIPGETWYESNVVKAGRVHIWGKYMASANGSIFAEYCQQDRWTEDPKDPIHWMGYSMNRYFKTESEAIAWLNFLLTLEKNIRG